MFTDMKSEKNPSVVCGSVVPNRSFPLGASREDALERGIELKSKLKRLKSPQAED
jgi:hypothetical protein